MHKQAMEYVRTAAAYLSRAGFQAQMQGILTQIGTNSLLLALILIGAAMNIWTKS